MHLSLMQGWGGGGVKWPLHPDFQKQFLLIRINSYFYVFCVGERGGGGVESVHDSTALCLALILFM